MANAQLLDYVRQQVQSGVSSEYLKKVLMENEWTSDDVDEVFSILNVHALQGQGATVTGDNSAQHSYMNVTAEREDVFSGEKITIDKIIEKFIPIAGAIFFVVGLGYLIYANAWVHFPMEIRIGLGFFMSLVIIGGSFSLSEKMRYFTDIGIGSGVLLMYATLIYGSRTTDLATAVIPEVVTLFTAVLFTLAVSYFASKRNSRVILILGMVGAYITPFVIGQNDVWIQSISFNAYLIYFFAINVSVFLIGREISVRDIIPLNIMGLFIGISTLWHLSYTDNINTVHVGDFFTGELFTSILLMAVAVFSIWSILLSAKRFDEKDDGYLSLGYIAPIIWFMFNIDNLRSLTDLTVGMLYAIIAVACFTGWHVLLGMKTRFQHTALYAAGLLSAVLAFFAFFRELDVYTSMLIAYLSLIFAVLYVLDSGKTERFVSYGVISLMGSILSVGHILDANLRYETLLIVITLVPAMCAYLIASMGGRSEFLPFARVYSFLSAVVALMFVLAEFLEYIDLNFLLFYVAPLLLLGYIVYFSGEMSHDAKSRLMRGVLVWFALGFVSVFFYLIGSIYPAPTDTFIFTHTDRATDWILVKGIFATIILFTGLLLSRRLQKEQVIKRPSFILVIFGFATLLLTGNYIISAMANDLQVSMAHGGPRAIATTIWWVAIAIYMLFVGLRFGKKYYAEKLLGLILLLISVGKVVLYDMITMEMQNKIIILMIIGGAMLLFSYFVKSKDLLTNNA
ncbi:MAG: DUF2339 domain-containing protein [Candidatus Pacebacteria bacterium]|nr:DUF2339 domain-containing protein [Candidatus Paceibacterota bacterium]